MGNKNEIEMKTMEITRKSLDDITRNRVSILEKAAGICEEREIENKSILETEKMDSAKERFQWLRKQFDLTKDEVYDDFEEIYNSDDFKKKTSGMDEATRQEWVFRLLKGKYE